MNREDLEFLPMHLSSPRHNSENRGRRQPPQPRPRPLQSHPERSGFGLIDPAAALAHLTGTP